MSGDGRLSGKVALVTGGGRGIGAAIARKFAAHGAKVVIGDIHEENGRRVADEFGEAGAFQPLNVRNVKEWDAAVAAATARFGRLDILVNNAGTGHSGPIEEEDPEAHRALVDLNLTGVWAGIRAVAGVMGKQGGGSIINISSIDGLAGMPYLSTYVATKFAVTGMTKSLAMELGDRGIRVNSIHPGIIETELVKGVTGPAMDRLRAAINRQPLKRIGKPEDIANAALFLASDESSYCTGSSLVVDGGHLAGPYRDPLPS
jgi:3alpha(or 20beta)-hydroxysteroid dehydrogenase